MRFFIKAALAIAPEASSVAIIVWPFPSFRYSGSYAVAGVGLIEASTEGPRGNRDGKGAS